MPLASGGWMEPGAASLRNKAKTAPIKVSTKIIVLWFTHSELQIGQDSVLWKQY